MNPTAGAAAARLESLESRFALRVASRLAEATEALPDNAAERLRFAREQALARGRARRATVTATTPVATGGGTAALGGPPSRWFKFAAVLPLVALVAGLLLISEWNMRQQVAAAAEIDAALLADDLPPGAYSDPGFVEFLKIPHE